MKMNPFDKFWNNTYEGSLMTLIISNLDSALTIGMISKNTIVVSLLYRPVDSKASFKSISLFTIIEPTNVDLYASLKSLKKIILA
jgi:hypothetical protein